MDGMNKIKSWEVELFRLETAANDYVPVGCRPFSELPSIVYPF
jgi:hypothetical protein